MANDKVIVTNNQGPYQVTQVDSVTFTVAPDPGLHTQTIQTGIKTNVHSKTLAGSVRGRGTFSGVLAIAKALAGSIAGRGSVSGPLAVAKALASSATGHGAVTGALSVANALAGTITGRSTLSGNLSLSQVLAGSVVGRGVLSGILTVTSSFIFTDDFTAANGTNLNGRTTTTGSKTWAVTGATTFDIQSNQAHSNSTGVDIFASVDAGVANLTFQVAFTGSVGTGGICWRRSDDNNHWLVQAGGGVAHIYKRVAGNYTDLGSIGVTPVQNDVLKVVASGNTHSVYVNNVLATTLTDSFNNTATQVGLKGFAINQSFDNAQAST